MISVQNQLVGASIGQTVTLDCHSEAYPKSINYWMFKNVIIAKGKWAALLLLVIIIINVSPLCLTISRAV